MPQHGSARAGLSRPGTSRPGVAGTGPPLEPGTPAGTGPPPEPGTPAGIRALAFAGAALVVLYVPDAGSDALRSVDTAGCAPAEYGLPERLALSGGSPAARALRDARPEWLTPSAHASCPEGCPPPPPARTTH
ncbi:PAS sensor protein, partial [Streptomyces sp. NPDC127079]